MQLKARTHRREESLAELAEDVEHLVRLAYPEVAEAMVVMEKDQFVDTLPDEDMRLCIHQNKPATLRDSSRAGILPTGGQTEGQVCAGGSTGGERPCIV